MKGEGGMKRGREGRERSKEGRRGAKDFKSLQPDSSPLLGSGLNSAP